MADSKLNDIIGTSLEKIKALADGETVIGNPITTPNGTTVIPVSKISMGFASGGIDYTGKKNRENDKQNFGGGGGTGVTLTPIGFLVTKADGSVEFMPVAKGGGGAVYKPDTVETVLNFVENSPELVKKFKDLFTKDKVEDEDDEEEENEETEQTAE